MPHGGAPKARGLTASPNFFLNGNPILVVWDGQGRPWFECPACGPRRKHVYLDELRCRVCCRLDYASRRLRRTAQAELATRGAEGAWRSRAVGDQGVDRLQFGKHL